MESVFTDSMTRDKQGSLVVRIAKSSDMEAAAESFREVASERKYLATEEVAPNTGSMWRENWKENAVKNLFAVADSNGMIVGGIVLTSPSSPKSSHVRYLGMWLIRAFRGQGVGSELLRFAENWARDRGSITRIILDVYASNIGAINLYIKHGFQFEGCRKKNAFVGGAFVDEISMAKDLSVKKQAILP